MSRWHAEAACLDHDNPDLWHPEVGADPTPAQQICATCPVVRPCLAEAVATVDRSGIRGGMTAQQRRYAYFPGGRWPEVPPYDEVAVSLAIAGFTPGGKGALSTFDRAEAVRRLHARGLGDQAIARHLSIAPETVLRIRRRHGLPANRTPGANE